MVGILVIYVKIELLKAGVVSEHHQLFRLDWEWRKRLLQLAYTLNPGVRQ